MKKILKKIISFYLALFLLSDLSSCAKGEIIVDDLVFKNYDDDQTFKKEIDAIYNYNKHDFALIKEQNLSLRLLFDFFDINNDGIVDVFVYYNSSFYCGSSGCLTEAFIVKKGNEVKNVFSVRSYGQISVIKDGSQYSNIILKGSRDSHIKNYKNLFLWNEDLQRYQLK